VTTTERQATRPFELDPARADVVPEPPPANLPAAAGGEEVREPEAEIIPPGRGGRRGWRGRLAALFGIGLLGTLTFQAVDYVGDLVATDPLLGWPLALFLIVTVASAVGWVGLEMRDFRALSGRAHLRRNAERLAASDLHGEAAPLLAEVTAELGGPRTAALAPALARFEASASDALSDAERLRLYERQVLAPVDRLAYGAVLAGGRDIGVITALSPLGLLDGVFVLWRTTVMLRAVARLYGMAPGPAATLSLLRRCLRNATIAGLADIMSHAALEHVGAGILAMLSARAGQGAGNALLASRLGLEAIRQCRPLPFVAEEPPRLSRMRKALLEGLPAGAQGSPAPRQQRERERERQRS
jgi:putative membrane protein